VSVLGYIKNEMMKKSRQKKLAHFYTLCPSEAKVLDVGVSNIEHNDQINIFLHEFRFSSDKYTGLAIENMDKIRQQNPDKRFVEYPGGVFPFSDKEFDWVFSNAVIEHVGDRDDQILFLNEMMRVSKNVYFTTPNKFFPVESHTNILFLHWSNNIFYRWCKKHNPYWSSSNLLLLDFNGLDELMKKSTAAIYKIYKNRIMGLTMTFSVVCSR
jgi:ubiquinone/menaquinone biosynthesis C-methylase UbiE